MGRADARRRAGRFLRDARAPRGERAPPLPSDAGTAAVVLVTEMIMRRWTDIASGREAGRAASIDFRAHSGRIEREPTPAPSRVTLERIDEAGSWWDSEGRRIGPAVYGGVRVSRVTSMRTRRPARLVADDPRQAAAGLYISQPVA